MSHTECNVCMDAETTHAFVPCGHYCVCGECARTLTSRKDAECPICRQAVTGYMRIYGNMESLATKPQTDEGALVTEPQTDGGGLVTEPQTDEGSLVTEPETDEGALVTKPKMHSSFSIEVENLYDPKNYSSHGCRICPYLIQGCCISVKWAENWHECYVLSYNEKDGTHKCRYHGGRNGGLERTYHLNRKIFLVVSVPPLLQDSRMRNIELSKEYAKRVGVVPKPQFLVNVNYEYDPNRYSKDLDNDALVGCKIGIKWTNGNYHTCQVTSYNSEDGTHTCVYSSGRRRELHLNRFHFVMVCARTQYVDIMKARPWADKVIPKEPTRYPLL